MFFCSSASMVSDLRRFKILSVRCHACLAGFSKIEFLEVADIQVPTYPHKDLELSCRSPTPGGINHELDS